ncbi:cytochrome P450 [Streptomyces sp. NPDC049881]|uniref:cytochrome P450 family protein n=1 Tax=Streptomyces sp. NPDC049881 TaxID=3155778 RepID=UPI0034286998
MQPYPLDPTAADHHGEAAALRALGPVVPVVLPGGVPAWAVTRHDLLTSVLHHPDISKNPRHWRAVRERKLPDGWPLTGMVMVTNMVTADGADHRRLRRLVTNTLTSARVRAMRPEMAALANALAQALPSHSDTGVVDLRAHYAYPLPMRVICDLVGVPDQDRPRLRELVENIFSSVATPDEVTTTQHDIHRLLGQLVADRTRHPADDLTSALIAARATDPTGLSDDELAGTLWLLISAGHETTLSLITNAVRALLTHPAQLDWVLHHAREERTVRAAGQPVRPHHSVWDAVIEETLRWDAPIGNFLARYPTTDLTLAGTTIPEGDAILAPYSLVNRDPDQHGPTADLFDVTRPQARHLAFGGGPHFCLGASLARTEAAIALDTLFTHWPGIRLAVPDRTLTPVPSLITNSVTTLPIHLGPEHQ